MRFTAPRLLAAALLVALIAAPAFALAQSGPPPRGPSYGSLQDDDGFFLRRGLAGGLGFGLGALSTDSGIFDCPDCVVHPVAVSISGHLGWMLDHRTSLGGAYWGQVQRLDFHGDAYGWQHMLMGAVQHWLTPQFWIKGGLGLASLQVSYWDGFAEELNVGTAVMAAAGYEVIFTPDFAFDIQVRLGSGMYRYVSDRASTAVIGVGVSWY